VARLWSRPVHLETWFDDENTLLSTDGKKFEKKVLESKESEESGENG